jgi:hypothetical protein
MTIVPVNKEMHDKYNNLFYQHMTGKINVGKKVTEHHKVILKNIKRYSL